MGARARSDVAASGLFRPAASSRAKPATARRARFLPPARTKRAGRTLLPPCCPRSGGAAVALQQPAEALLSHHIFQAGGNKRFQAAPTAPRPGASSLGGP